MIRTLAAALLALTAYKADAATLLAYQSINTSSAEEGLDAAVFADGIFPERLARGPGLGLGGGTSTFNSSSWGLFNNAADALSDGSFLTFGFFSNTGFDLDTLDIRYDRSPTGPLELVLELDANNDGFSPIFSDTAIDVDGESIADIDLTSFTNITSAVFRIVGFGATSNSGTFDIENEADFGGFGIVVSGEASPVPLPGAGLLLLGGLGALGAARLRRRA